MAKETGILINPHTGKEYEYDLAHAWAIMDMQNNGGWAWKGKPPLRPGQAAMKTKKKKGTNAGNSPAITGEATSAAQPEEDCGCH